MADFAFMRFFASMDKLVSLHILCSDERLVADVASIHVAVVQWTRRIVATDDPTSDDL